VDICGPQFEFSRMSPPRVGESSRTGQNTRSSARVTRTQEMPTVMDVDEIHTPEYDPTTTHIEEEQNTTQAAGQPEEDAERTKFNVFMGKGMQQEEQATDSTQQGLEQGPRTRKDCEKECEAIPAVGVLSPQGKKKASTESSAQGVQQKQENWP
jgi:hypothetical protein